MHTRLRNYGIYRLPNELRPVFAHTPNDTEFYLYDCRMGRRLPPRFIVQPDGKLINWFGDFPVWTVADLVDTGETQAAAGDE